MISQLWKGPIPIAHRGSRFLWPENTMEAFAGAVDLGIAHLETDLRITSDGVLVCFHDLTLDRTTDGIGEVPAFTLDEVSGFDAGYRHEVNGDFPFRGKGIRVPTLDELVTSFPDVGLVLDLKDDGIVAPLARAVDTHGLHDRVVVGSFSDRRLDEFRQLTRGRVATSTGPYEVRRWLVASRLGMGPGSSAQALQVPARSRGVLMVDHRLIRVARQSGLDVHVWTVNEADEMNRLLDLGVDGVITDRPDLLIEVLTARGER